MLLPFTLAVSILVNLILAQTTTSSRSSSTSPALPAPTTNVTLTNITIPITNSTLSGNSTSTTLNNSTSSSSKSSTTSYQTASIPSQFTASIHAFSPQNTVSSIYSGPNDNYIASSAPGKSTSRVKGVMVAVGAMLVGLAV